jgi:hypothetical protein
MPSVTPGVGETQDIEIGPAPGAAAQRMHEKSAAGRIPESGAEQDGRERQVEAAGASDAFRQDRERDADRCGRIGLDRRLPAGEL